MRNDKFFIRRRKMRRWRRQCKPGVLHPFYVAQPRRHIIWIITGPVRRCNASETLSLYRSVVSWTQKGKLNFILRLHKVRVHAISAFYAAFTLSRVSRAFRFFLFLSFFFFKVDAYPREKNKLRGRVECSTELDRKMLPYIYIHIYFVYCVFQRVRLVFKSWLFGSIESAFF